MYLKFNNDNHITYRIYLFLSPFSCSFASFLLLVNGFTLIALVLWINFEFGFGFGYEGKSHVNVTFALVPLKRLNSVKVCDKMSTSSLVRGALGAWGRCVGGVACVELSFYARLAPSRAARNRQSMLCCDLSPPPPLLSLCLFYDTCVWRGSRLLGLSFIYFANHSFL